MLYSSATRISFHSLQKLYSYKHHSILLYIRSNCTNFVLYDLWVHFRWWWSYNWKRLHLIAGETQASVSLGQHKHWTFFHLSSELSKARCVLSLVDVSINAPRRSSRLGSWYFDLGNRARFRLLFWSFLRFNLFMKPNSIP